MASDQSTYDLMDAYTSVRQFMEEALLWLDVIVECEIERMAEAAAALGSPPGDSLHNMYMTHAEAKLVLMEPASIGRLTAEQLSVVVQLEQRILARIYKTKELQDAIPIADLYDQMELTPVLLRAVIVALAPHANRKYLKLYGYLHDDMSRQYVSLDLLFRLCCFHEEERAELLDALTDERSWFKQIFTRIGQDDHVQEQSLLFQPIKLIGRAVHYLLGQSWTYTGALASVRLYSRMAAPRPTVVHQELEQSLFAYAGYANRKGQTTVILLQGAPGSGKTFLGLKAAGQLQRSLLEWDIDRAPEDELNFRYTLQQFLLEARLLRAIPAINRVHTLKADQHDRRLQWLFELLPRWDGLVFMFSREECKPPSMSVNVTWLPLVLPALNMAEGGALWAAFSAERLPLTAEETATLAGKFNFTPGQIDASIAHAARLQKWRELGGNAEPHSTPAGGMLLHEATYQLIDHRLREKAVKINPTFIWDDLVLPADTIGLLRQACDRLRLRQTVMNDWGFERKLPYGRGISMLFTGPPGTGKTMSASVIAGDMQAELYRVDLSRVVSKYIGETEKNLSDIFDQAKLSGAILFFDEADALFGKRSEVKDAHDKYANMETSYLLQKMEEYDGLTILATNFSQNLDEAFTRRIQFIIKFPFPDAVQREQLWRTAFPREFPTEDIDFAFMAEHFELTGGPIKNIVLTSAYLAAGEQSDVKMKHLMEAVMQEYKKTGKLFPKDRLGEYAQYVPQIKGV
ncbi:ATP-binding protein [Paenibacillus thalictri]|uniref:ATP-binding protein n=1 Tax=Paenibacillus thalictri TaxID=2527873 RepID=A0A4Q9DM72_9BACL|nr:ATP-binding protein [Paenibacillus thalictri]TBL76342.1 ATP-binding protein [Paenibacillus thalictri]